MTRVAGVIIFQAKPGMGEETAMKIAAVQPEVEAEPGTTQWLVLRSNTNPDSIFLVDLFDSETSLNAHMAGQAASQIFATVPELLAAEPELHPSVIIAGKFA